MLKTNPAVFAVNKNYQIIIPANCESFCSVLCGGREYFNHSAGIMRLSRVHKVDIPMDVLNAAGEYEVMAVTSIFDEAVAK